MPSPTPNRRRHNCRSCSSKPRPAFAFSSRPTIRSANCKCCPTQAQNNRLNTYQQNISDAQAKLNSSVSTLNQVSNLLTQAKDLALQGSNSTNSPEAYQALGSQVDSILNEVIQLANTQQSGQYLYGGTASQTTPFTVNAQGQIVYNGSAQALNEPIGQGQQVQTLYAGSQVFQSLQRGTTVYTGTTGAVAGSGTDSATGSGTLTVAHTSTTYAAGSGVQAGTNSVSGDTILGPSRRAHAHHRRYQRQRQQRHRATRRRASRQFHEHRHEFAGAGSQRRKRFSQHDGHHGWLQRQRGHHRQRHALRRWRCQQRAHQFQRQSGRHQQPDRRRHQRQ